MLSVNFIKKDSHIVSPKTHINELLDKNIKPLPDSSSSDSANSFRNFFTQKIHCEVSTVVMCIIAMINFDVVSKEELLAFVRKCPNTVA